ncbi:MAG: hypothetical protein ACXWCH_34015 [Burkholderiales bacterium]
MKFGFADLGPGRYLEWWVPANLISDQFDLMLKLPGRRTPPSRTHRSPMASPQFSQTKPWLIAFPARFTARGRQPLFPAQALVPIPKYEPVSVINTAGWIV